MHGSKDASCRGITTTSSSKTSRRRRDPVPGDRPQGRRLRAPRPRRYGERHRLQPGSRGASPALRRTPASTGCTSSISTAPLPAARVNGEAVAAIRSAVDLRIQLGGGIRDRAAIEQWLAFGIDRVVLGTAALRDPELVRQAAADHPGKIVVGIDARDGRVAIEGWVETTEIGVVELARRYRGLRRRCDRLYRHRARRSALRRRCEGGCRHRAADPNSGHRFGRRRLARRHCRAQGARGRRHRRDHLRARAL